MSVHRLAKTERPAVQLAARPSFNPGTTPQARACVLALWRRARERLEVLVNVEGLDVHRAALDLSRGPVAATIEALRDRVRLFEGVDQARAVWSYPPIGAVWCFVEGAVVPVFVVEGAGPAEGPEPAPARKRRRRRRRRGGKGRAS